MTVFLQFCLSAYNLQFRYCSIKKSEWNARIQKLPQFKNLGKKKNKKPTEFSLDYYEMLSFHFAFSLQTP